MVRCLRFAAAVFALHVGVADANAANTNRPPIVGVAHIALQTNDTAGAK